MFVIAIAGILATATGQAAGKPVLAHNMKSIDGKDVDLAKEFRGKVVLFVNVASACGYTGQYAGLQALHDKYASKGLVVVGVPSNEFGSQEPGTNAQIAEFCKKEYKVTFPMMAKVEVKGAKACGLYKALTSKDSNPSFSGEVGWNFTKFLVGKDGACAARFDSGVEPSDSKLVTAIEKALAN
ncbi:MAG: glutathione peroxidase [Planctomycetota bacterium]